MEAGACESAQVRAAQLKPILAGRSKPVHALLGNAELERVANLTPIAALDAPGTKAQLKREAGMKRGACLNDAAFAVQTAQPGYQGS